MHVAFVCTYNRARSVMAATMFAQQLEDRGLGDRVRVTSSGTHAAGQCIDARAARVLANHDYADQSTTHRPTGVGAEVLAADLVVAMTGQHVWDLKAVGADRVRLLRSFDPKATDNIDVSNPVTFAEFEHAYRVIDDALPGLHDWVDERLTSVTYGWRFWGVPPATADVLCAPYKSFHGAWMSTWPSTKHHASCFRDRQHVAPDPGCECGIYADRDAKSACNRAVFAVSVPTFITMDRRAALVVGQVALEGAVTYVPPLSGIPELRAAAAEILELYILPVRHQPDAQLLVEPLTARYQVPVHYGFP